MLCLCLCFCAHICTLYTYTAFLCLHGPNHIYSILVQHLLIAASDGVADDDAVVAAAAAAASAIAVLCLSIIVGIKCESKALCWKILLLCFLFTSLFHFVLFFFYFAEYILVHSGKRRFFSSTETMERAFTHIHIHRSDRAEHESVISIPWNIDCVLV